MKVLTDNNGICYICGEKTNNLAGNPAKWPIEINITGAIDGEKIYHRGCMLSAIDEFKQNHGKDKN